MIAYQEAKMLDLDISEFVRHDAKAQLIDLQRAASSGAAMTDCAPKRDDSKALKVRPTLPRIMSRPMRK
jgi:hypothetical protein